MSDRQPGVTELASADQKRFPSPESINVPAADARPPAVATTTPSRWQGLVRRLLRRTAAPVRVVLWNGEECVEVAQPVATVRIRDHHALFRLLRGVDPAFGELFGEGRIEVEGDLVAFMEAVLRALPDGASAPWPGAAAARRLARWWRNLRRDSRGNVAHHYDLGNDFYRLWLDDQLVYTCAYFPSPELSLEEAQVAKMEHVCRKLRLRPGQTVLEVGCGWGALALHAARHHGVSVTAYNLSREQIAYARARAKAEGLDGQVRFVEDDYRAATERCDAFVSVGMLEHVRPENYRALGNVIHRCLKPTGVGLLHSIGRNAPVPPSPWLDKYVFPGHYIPSLGEMMAVFEPWGLSVLDVENLRMHYALTLRHWLKRFDAAAARVRERMDEAFIRTWRLYLASSQAGFAAGKLQLFQIVFAPANNNDLPWSRRHIYAAEPGQPEGDHVKC